MHGKHYFNYSEWSSLDPQARTKVIETAALESEAWLGTVPPLRKSQFWREVWNEAMVHLCNGEFFDLVTEDIGRMKLCVKNEMIPDTDGTFPALEVSGPFATPHWELKLKSMMNDPHSVLSRLHKTQSVQALWNASAARTSWALNSKLMPMDIDQITPSFLLPYESEKEAMKINISILEVLCSTLIKDLTKSNPSKTEPVKRNYPGKVLYQTYIFEFYLLAYHLGQTEKRLCTEKEIEQIWTNAKFGNLIRAITSLWLFLPVTIFSYIYMKHSQNKCKIHQ